MDVISVLNDLFFPARDVTNSSNSLADLSVSSSEGNNFSDILEKTVQNNPSENHSSENNYSKTEKTSSLEQKNSTNSVKDEEPKEVDSDCYEKSEALEENEPNEQAKQIAQNQQKTKNEPAEEKKDDNSLEQAKKDKTDDVVDKKGGENLSEKKAVNKKPDLSNLAQDQKVKDMPKTEVASENPAKQVQQVKNNARIDSFLSQNNQNNEPVEIDAETMKKFSQIASQDDLKTVDKVKIGAISKAINKVLAGGDSKETVTNNAVEQKTDAKMSNADKNSVNKNTANNISLAARKISAALGDDKAAVINDLIKEAASHNANNEKTVMPKVQAADLRSEMNQKVSLQNLGGKDGVNAAVAKQGADSSVVSAASKNAASAATVKTEQFKLPIQVAQIAKNIRLHLSQGNTQMRMILQPENLGELKVRVSYNSDSINLSLRAETTQVKNLLENNINQLKEALEQQGIKLADCQVNVDQDENSYHAQESRGKFGNRQRNLTSDKKEEIKETAKPEDIGMAVFLDRGTTVNYIV